MKEVEEFLKSKGINLDYARGINMCQDVGFDIKTIPELLEEYAEDHLTNYLYEICNWA